MNRNQYLDMCGMEFFAYHGCYRDEELNGNHFRVDLRLYTDLDRAAQSDDLDDALDYVLVYEVVKAEMNVRSTLVENVCKRILTSIFAHFPQLEGARISIAKLHPDIGEEIEQFRVVMEEDRFGKPL